MLTAVAVVGFGPTGCGTMVDDPGRPPELVAYAQCMRSHGVPGFPDPVDGRLDPRFEKGTELDPDSPQFQAAQQACKSVEPPGLQPPGRQPEQTSSPSGERRDPTREFAACMRANGVPRFPDPQPDGRIRLDPGSGVDPESATFKSAQETCRKLMPGGVVPGGH